VNWDSERMLDLLACPRDFAALTRSGEGLSCPDGHSYPMVSGIPVLLVEEDDPTGYATRTLAEIRGGTASYSTDPQDGIDETVQKFVAATGGYFYKPVIGRLPRYPIPKVPQLDTDTGLFLDVGAGWGRWSIAAARKGFTVVALDPWLEELAAAVRVAKQMGVEILPICGDATKIPVVSGGFDVAFSYSVLQHFDKGEAARSLAEMSRCLKPGGTLLVQLPNIFGVRQLFNRMLQLLGQRDTGPFRVRYWTGGQMRRSIAGSCEASVEIDGFFSLNPRSTDVDLLPLR